MPNIKAADKWVRQSKKRALRNRDLKTRLKTLFKSGVAEPANAGSVESQLDKAAQKGVIHKNKAARKKSRLAKAVNAAKAAPGKSAGKAAGAAKPARRKAAAKK